VGLGSFWLTPKIGEFLELYPEISIQLVFSDEELDLSMREADVAIRLRQPVQADLVQRKLFTVHFHAYASPDYLKKNGTPRSPEELDGHRLLTLGGQVPSYYSGLNWLVEAGRNGGEPRHVALTVNNAMGLRAAVENGAGIATLPDYIAEGATLVQLFQDRDAPTLDAYFVYPEELRSLARLQVFRDFLISKAQRWSY
jgi:DNA-binding transcriptional LysR family regulator